MTESSYYVYALKDPRKSPALPFYIGKGTGTRAWDHLLAPDNTPKGARIREIIDGKFEVLVTVLLDGLSELQALRMESELISAFGTIEAGGILTNSVLPSGKVSRNRKNLIVPSGCREKAQLGLDLLKNAVLELSKANASGVTNADVAKALGLQSDYAGGSKDYLSWSLLGLLMKEGRMKRDNTAGKGFHVSQVR